MDRNFALTTKIKRITAKIIGPQSARDFEGVCSDVVALLTGMALKASARVLLNILRTVSANPVALSLRISSQVGQVSKWKNGAILMRVFGVKKGLKKRGVW
jgi:hypothetical protein